MPSRILLICIGIGLIAVGAMVSGGLFLNRGHRVLLDGQIRKTRVAALSPTRSVVVLDFRATNTSNFPFLVDAVEVEVTLADGKKQIGQFVPEVDAKTLFPALPALGDKLAVSIGIRENIASKATVERMAAASFAIPESDLAARKDLLLRIREIDGPKSELR